MRMRLWLAFRVLFFFAFSLFAFGRAALRPSLTDQVFDVLAGCMLLYFGIKAERLRRRVRAQASPHSN
jgi:hypothetical protein